MGYTAATKNAAVDAITARGAYITVHTGDPGTTGANLASGITPQLTTWGSASGGVGTGSQVSYAAAPAAHYTHYGVWNNSSMTTFIFGDLLDPDITFGAPGTLYVTPRVTFP
jgi:hypothetical protein